VTRVIRTAVVDDQELVRDGFSMILRAQPDLEVAATLSNGREFLHAVRSGQDIDVALMDIRMPIMDGIAATRAVTEMPHAPAVIVVTTFDHDEYVLDAIAAGARGFLLKRCSTAELVDAVRKVACGVSILSPEITEAVLARVRATATSQSWDIDTYKLTPREYEILALIGSGLNNTEIAGRLYLSMSSVKTHVGNVLNKTHSRDRVQAAILAIRAGI